METRKTATDEAATGTPDAHYNLISVIYHALQGAETYDQYAADAERAGDRELARFLRDVQAENRRRAERAKDLLYERLGEREGQDGRSERSAAAPGGGRDEFGERERRRVVEAGHVTSTSSQSPVAVRQPGPQMAAGGEVRTPDRPPEAVAAPTERVVPAPDVRQPVAGQPGSAPTPRAPVERGFAAGQDTRNASRTFEEVEPELRRDYEAERPGGDPWEHLREQVRSGFTQARQSQSR
jgi:hypothetical protein